jgi:hypothetical protein
MTILLYLREIIIQVQRIASMKQTPRRDILILRRGKARRNIKPVAIQSLQRYLSTIFYFAGTIK